LSTLSMVLISISFCTNNLQKEIATHPSSIHCYHSLNGPLSSQAGNRQFANIAQEQSP
jgi:hypothetical protein